MFHLDSRRFKKETLKAFQIWSLAGSWGQEEKENILELYCSLQCLKHFYIFFHLILIIKRLKKSGFIIYILLLTNLVLKEAQ